MSLQWGVQGCLFLTSRTAPFSILCQAGLATPRSITTTNLDFATLKCNKPEHTITHVPRKTAKQKVIQINQMETMKKLENLGQENFTGVKNCLLMKIALIVSIVPGSHVLFFA